MTPTVTMTAESAAKEVSSRTRAVYDLAHEYGVTFGTYTEIIQKILHSNNRALAPTRRRTPLSYGNPLAAITVNTLAAMELSDVIFSRNIGTEDVAGYRLRQALDAVIALSRRLATALAAGTDENAGMKLDREAPLFDFWPATKSLIQGHKFFDPDGNEMS